ncbi:MAG: DUF3147 family protein [Candidatus Syntrophosphaera sp.]|nr:DUF3147 family protein [Candidatus Syntrophosphaera sp.]
MMYYALKIIISAFLILVISEISKRSTLIGAIFASMPLVSFLAILWLYRETKDTKQIAALSNDIFWLVLPSLLFFIVFPLLLRRALNFYLAFAISLTVMLAGYFLMSLILRAK